MTKRIYDAVIRDHFAHNRQMAFLCGPRQVGKTTTSRALAGKAFYLNWDTPEVRQLALGGAQSLAAHFDLLDLSATKPLLVFDELHKYGKWKSLLKGFFDQYGERCHCLVTGSARLDIYKRGGDSLAGRYFTYRMHPLSIGELCSTSLPADELIREPQQAPADQVANLIRFGGFPEPFLRQNTRFYNRWVATRHDVILREDLRDLTKVQEVTSVQLLVELLKSAVGNPLNQSNLAANLQVSVDSVARWLRYLESLFVIFTVRPWHKAVTKAIRKQPKIYFRDWSVLNDTGTRHENFVAAHLLKAVHLWQDLGYGTFELCYLRDKAKREVDFVVVRDGKPWFLVEVKTGQERHLNPHLAYFQQLIGAHHAFQVVGNAPFVAKDCFKETKPIKVPLVVLLSQLV